MQNDVHGVPAPLKLISVLVRTTGRSSLAEAIASIKAQDYRPLEIVVVDAAAKGLPVLNSALDPDLKIQICTPEAPLNRCAAANFALDNAQGELLIFLDDDDYFLDGHLSRLASALAQHLEAPLAYAGVACERGQPPLRSHVFDAPFFAARLRVENYIPIHAAMFRRSVLSAGCRFDIALTLHEDWDFWLQVLRIGPFIHCPGISAIYKLGDGGSGIWSDTHRVNESLMQIRRKWWSEWTPEDLHAYLNSLHEELEYCRKAFDDAHLAADQYAQSLHDELSKTHSAAEEHAKAMEIEVVKAQHEAATLRAEMEKVQHEASTLRTELSEIKTRPLQYLWRNAMQRRQ